MYSFHGQFSNNMKNGQGEQAYPNGDIFRGGFKDDNRHGYGVVTYFATGDVYRGQVLSRPRVGRVVVTGGRSVVPVRCAIADTTCARACRCLTSG